MPLAAGPDHRIDLIVGRLRKSGVAASAAIRVTIVSGRMIIMCQLKHYRTFGERLQAKAIQRYAELI